VTESEATISIPTSISSVPTIKKNLLMAKIKLPLNLSTPYGRYGGKKGKVVPVLN
jgi:hypothetical protein